jgi:phage shock protein C
MRKFYRIKKGKMVFGLCNGLGQYFNIDPVLIRLAFIVLTLASIGTAIIFYLIASLVTPIMES